MPFPNQDRDSRSGLRRGLSTPLDALLAAIVAPACASCDALLDQPTAGPVCAACWSRIRFFTPPVCAACGDPLPAGRLADVPAPLCRRCRDTPSPIARSRAVGEYSGTLRAAVHLLKYDKRRSIAPRLAAMMSACGADVLRDAHATIPVPLHWGRRWQRGFNQASLLASHLGLPVWPALVRRRATRPQVDLAASARRVNVRGAFAVSRRRWPWRRPWAARLKGKIVVLIDDVSTTGATLEACATALQDAGVAEVRALTAARVVGSPRR